MTKTAWVDMKTQFAVPSDGDLVKYEQKKIDLQMVRGIFKDIKAAEAKAEKNACRLDAGRRQCQMKWIELYNLATLHFEAAQVMKNSEVLSPAMPLFAAACSAFSTMGMADNAEMIWEVGLSIQHDGRYLDAAEFYTALHEVCTPHETDAIAFGRRLAEKITASVPRPECLAGGGDGGLRVKGATVTADSAAKSSEQIDETPEFCPILDITTSKHGPQQFLDEYVLKSRPVVLRGLPPLSEPFRQGDGLISGLLQDHGDSVVTSWLTPHGQFYSSEVSANSSEKVAARPAEVPLRLRDLIEVLRRNATELGVHAYGQHINLDREVPKLAKSLFLDQHGSGPQLLAALPFRRVNLWLAGTQGNVKNALHWDAHDNLLYQLRCGKEFLIFPPGDKDKLYYPTEEQEAKEEEKGSLQWHLNMSVGVEKVDWRLEPNPKSIHNGAAVDLLNPDYVAYPKLKEVMPPRKCTLRAGDALFLPAYWHHAVGLLSGKEGGANCKCVNVAVNYWYRPLYTDEKAAEAAAASLARTSEL